MKFKFRKNDVLLYRRWQTMKNRCYNEKAERYYNYGGRGIIFCDEWLNYDIFYLWAINNGYSKELTIERINVNGNYEPNNCKFILPEEQALNTRKTLYLCAFGERKTAIEWAKDLRCVVSIRNIYNRYSFGWTHERIITEPIEDHIQTSKRIGRARPLSAFGEVKSIGEWVNDNRCMVCRRTLKGRLSRGWDVERALTTPVKK